MNREEYIRNMREKFEAYVAFCREYDDNRAGDYDRLMDLKGALLTAIEIDESFLGIQFKIAPPEERTGGVIVEGDMVKSLMDMVDEE